MACLSYLFFDLLYLGLDRLYCGFVGLSQRQLLAVSGPSTCAWWDFVLLAMGQQCTSCASADKARHTWWSSRWVGGRTASCSST